MAANPSLSSLRGGVDPVLSAELAGLVNDAERYLSAQVVPPRDGVAAGARESGTVITSSGLFGDASTPYKRAIGASNNHTPGEDVGNIKYQSDEFNMADHVDGRKINGALIDFLGFTVTDLFARLSIGREKDLNTLLTTAGNWADSFTAGTAWNNASADPFNDIDTMMTAKGKFGVDPNTIYFSKAGFDALRRNPGVKQYFSVDSQRNLISKPRMIEAIAAELGVPEARVFVQETSHNTANAGQPKSIEYLNGANRFCWIGYIDTGAGVIAGEQGLTMRPTAAARVVTEAPAVLTDELLKPYKGPYVLAKWQEALFSVNTELGGLITC